MARQETIKINFFNELCFWEQVAG